mmetsp:Transcript_2784/g.7508  ORF Transcript_2784/g.7508 Transcript_2784/m.7508 type:complete len:264 (-) Transcript_2784:1139-1930(-)
MIAWRAAAATKNSSGSNEGRKNTRQQWLQRGQQKHKTAMAVTRAAKIKDGNGSKTATVGMCISMNARMLRQRRFYSRPCKLVQLPLYVASKVEQRRSNSCVLLNVHRLVSRSLLQPPAALEGCKQLAPSLVCHRHAAPVIADAAIDHVLQPAEQLAKARVGVVDHIFKWTGRLEDDERRRAVQVFGGGPRRLNLGHKAAQLLDLKRDSQVPDCLKEVQQLGRHERRVNEHCLVLVEASIWPNVTVLDRIREPFQGAVQRLQRC